MIIAGNSTIRMSGLVAVWQVYKAAEIIHTKVRVMIKMYSVCR